MNNYKKEERLYKIYDECKRIALNYCDLGEYENALGIVSAIANFMYHLNLIYKDDELENILKKSAEKYIECTNENDELDKRTVVFYDEFGLETRGLAIIYLKAFIRKGYHVIYITRYYRKGKISRIEDMLEKGNKCEIIFIDRGSYKEEAEIVLKIIDKFKAASLFIYDYPQGIVGQLVSYALKKGEIVSYKVNLTDHAFWLGTEATDYIIEFRNQGADISKYYRKIDESRLIKLPYYPEIDINTDFQGFPFNKGDSEVVFSGGSLYKTFGAGNVYYEIVDEMLSRYENIIFWYAGMGDISGLEKLMEKYPKRVFFTEERTDLFQIMKQCLFYLSTFPIGGGLMAQYAVRAGKIPVTLVHDDINRLVIQNADVLHCEFTTKESVLMFIDKIINDREYLQKLENRTRYQLISEEEFEKGIDSLIKFQKTEWPICFEKISHTDFTNLYLDNYDEKETYDIIYTKRTTCLKKINFKL